jgi:hypothetical protein
MSSLRFWIAVLPVVSALSLSACVSSMQNSPALDALKSAADGSSGSSSPFVEATVEYPGPSGRWAGPASFLLSLNAREAGDARIQILPQLWGPEAVPPAVRPAGGGLAHGNGDGVGSRVPASQTLGIPAEFVRERIAHLFSALQADTAKSAGVGGCLYPVRIRLVRADGGLVERQGCRGLGAWTGAVSAFTSEFLTAITQPARTAKILEKARRSVASSASVKETHRETPVAPAAQGTAESH